jgi:hypothetical protein
MELWMAEGEERERARVDVPEEAEGKWPPEYRGAVALYVYFALRVWGMKACPLSS